MFFLIDLSKSLLLLIILALILKIWGHVFVWSFTLLSFFNGRFLNQLLITVHIIFLVREQFLNNFFLNLLQSCETMHLRKELAIIVFVWFKLRSLGLELLRLLKLELIWVSSSEFIHDLVQFCQIHCFFSVCSA